MPRASACGSRRPPEPSSPGAGETPPLHHDRPARRAAARSLAAGLLLAFVGLLAAAGPAQAQTLPEFTAVFTDANGNAVERLGEGESFGVRVSITNGVTFTTDETVTVSFMKGHHDEASTVIDADHPNDYSASSLPSATLVAGTTSVQLGTATVVDDGQLEPLEAFHAVVTLDGRSTEVSLLIEDVATGPIDLYFDEGDTIELNKPDTFDDRIDLALRLQNGDPCYVWFPFTTYLKVEDPDGVLSAWYVSSGSATALSVGEELAVNFAGCGRTRTIAFEINLNSGTVGPKVVTFRAGRTTEAFGKPEPTHHGRQRGPG